MKKMTQADHVAEMLAQTEVGILTDKLRIPGIESLHTKPFAEIAEVLTNVLRSKPNVTEVRWIVGEYIEITYKTV